MARQRRRKRRLMDDQIRLMRERGERLREAAQAIGITHAAKAAGVPYTTLRDYMNGGEMKFSALASLARVCGVSLDWIAFGAAGGSSSGAAEIQTTSTRQIVVPWYDNREDGLRIGRDWLQHAVPRDLSTLCLITNEGDAMEPTLSSGDLVIVDRGVTEVSGSALYALESAGTLMVRRLDPRLGGGVRVIADNHRYPPQDIAADRLDCFRLLGEVAWIGGVPHS
ncbi:LexA family transcriptional regulator [Gluconobacter kondonii]|nr:LexA family transcriptional regulator [Gluconobacter kondonii]